MPIFSNSVNIIKAGARAIRISLVCGASAALAACSTFPIPDDVMDISTEDIARHARCEMRGAIVKWFLAKGWVPNNSEDELIALFKATREKVGKLQQRNLALEHSKQIDINKHLGEREKLINKYTGVAVVYSFDFNITEANSKSAEAGFKLPFTAAPSEFSADAAAGLSTTRQGQRQFKASDSWGNMVIKRDRCEGVTPRPRNPVYPLDGSIGVKRVVDTFLDLSEQGGAKDSFVDTLIFTTQVGGGLNAVVKLNPATNAFRLVSAGGHLSASRIDVHKMVISLVFPHAASPEAIMGVERYDGDLNAPFARPAAWRARYNLCVADARDREDQLKSLRHTAPEIYCIGYADYFAWQLGNATVVKAAASGGQAQSKAKPSASGVMIRDQSTNRMIILPQGRPNVNLDGLR